MKKNIYQSPTLEINEIRLATGICSAGGDNPSVKPEGDGPGGEWEQAPRRL